jgi:type IV pilus assembly protein PilW
MLNRKHTAGGFSLVEIMVAVAIGLVTILVVTQVLVSSSARKQVSTSTVDAATNSAMALYAVEHDGKNAGYGISSVRGTLGCLVKYQNGTNAASSFPLLPVVITKGAGGASDTIRFMASSKNGITLPTRIAVDHAQNANNFYVDSDVGAQEGDLMIAATATLDTSATPTRWCTLFAATAPPAGSGTNIVWNDSTNPWNSNNTLMPANGYLIGDYLINLGTFVDHTYSINTVTNHLQLSDYDWVNNIPSMQDIYPNIVQLQAVYGLDTDGDNVVDTWTDTSPTTPVGWQQVRALRVAVVAQGREMDPDIVTLDGAVAASTCDSQTPHPAAICWKPDPNANGVKIDVNINNANPNWQHYRYRVIETTIPLRNLVWQQ